MKNLSKDTRGFILIMFHILVSIMVFSCSLYTYEYQVRSSLLMKIIDFIVGSFVTNVACFMNLGILVTLFVILDDQDIFNNVVVGILDVYDNELNLPIFAFIAASIVNGLITYFMWGPFIFGVI